MAFFALANMMPSSYRVLAAAPAQLPQVFFGSSTFSVTEGDSGTVVSTITVDINTAPVDNDVAVQYFTTNGSATAGSNFDYIATSGILTFTVGSTASQTFDVTINGDTIDESNETIVLFLTNAVNAEVGQPESATLTITDDDVTPTATPAATSSDAPVFVDAYEPNNEFSGAYTTAANAAKLTNITLWPSGDEDYFQFFGKAGSRYKIFTTDVDPGLDTVLKVYSPSGTKLAENDDESPGNHRSEVTITASKDGFYFARVLNKDPTDPTNRTYSIDINEIAPEATPTRVSGVDSCEPNNSIEQACLIGPNQTLSGMSFVPSEGDGLDTDFYRLPVKVGILYTCETSISATSLADTNIIFLDHNGGDFHPNLGNDDQAPGDLSSKLSYFSTYTGNLNIVVGPVNNPVYEDSDQYTYSLTCTSTAATPTPLPTATRVPSSGGSGGGGGSFPTAVPTATPIVFPTFPPTPTPIDLSSLTTPVPAPPVVVFQPLPTATAVNGGQQTTTVVVTIYYDSNFNFMPELTEGLSDISVLLYDNATGELLAFGYSNEGGTVSFDAVASSGAVRVSVPYLNYSQVVIGASSNILLRVDPRPLPIGIP